MQDSKSDYKRYYGIYQRLGPVRSILFGAWGAWLIFPAMSIGMLWLFSPALQKWVIFLVGGTLLWWPVLLWIGVRLWRRRYLRDAILLASLAGLSSAMILCTGGLLLVWQGGDIPLSWMLFLLMVVILLNWKYRNREVERWELARRKGCLKKYLDEKRWLIRYHPWEFSLVLSRAEGKYQEHIKRLRWVRRLDKWTPLVPGSAMLFRRTFGHEMTTLGILLCVMGAALMMAVQQLMLYFKIQAWDRARGAALVMIEGETKSS